VIRALLFDLDGLMVDSEPHSLNSWRVVLSTRGVVLEQNVIDRMFGLRQTDAARMLADVYGLAESPELLAREKEEYQITHLAGQVPPMPGLSALIEECTQRELRIAVASSGVRPYVLAVLEAVALTGRFSAIVTGDEVKNGKPAPDIFLAAAQALQVEPQQCMVLEDAPTGVQAAKAAGMRCIAVPNGHTRQLDLSAADLIFPSLNAVRDKLATLVTL
jgi:HAD superfamily hydrolase (TIGR01509 family)